MFSMELGGSAANSMQYRNHQAAPQTAQQPTTAQPMAPQQAQHQMFSTPYGYPSQQQQPSQYLSAYPNTAAGGEAKANMGFMPAPQQAPYMPPAAQQHQLFQYGYPSPAQQPSQQYIPQNARFPAGQQPYLGGDFYYPGASGPTHPAGGGRRRYSGGGPSGYYPPYRQVHNSTNYNHQHYLSSNNAVPEKTPTIYMTHPTTKKVMCIKLNRMYNTMADLRPQLQNRPGGSGSGNAAALASDLTLCLNFLSPRGCVHGSGCDKVHVAGVEYMWEPVAPKKKTVDGVTAYEPGFRIQCYDPSQTRYYTIPSELVNVTDGSEEYVAMFNEHGNNFKTKFKLCSDMVDHGKCAKGSQCENIHCTRQDLTGLEETSVQSTHVNDAEAMASVARLPANVTVRVFDQNSFESWHEYPGSLVLMTEGAKAYAKCYSQENHSVPTRKRMQHCAHFRLKDMCRLGSSCRFLHVLPTEEELAARKAAAAEAADNAEAPQANATNSAHNPYA